MMRAIGVSAAVFVLTVGAVRARGGDWPQFMGPDSTNVVTDSRGLPRQWPPDGPKRLWTVSVGEGFGPAAIHGDSVFILDRENSQNDVLRRLSLKDGREIWRATFSAPGRFDRNGSRSTPATDGRYVFAVGPMGDIYAVKYADGTTVWGAHLLRDWGAKRPGWAVSTSPLLCGTRVIVSPWGDNAALVAYDKATGKPVWTTPNPLPAGQGNQDYTSPVLATLAGKRTVIAAGRNGSAVIGADPETGRELWRYTGFPKCSWLIPSPAALPDGRVLITGGYGAGAAMFKVAQQGGAWTVEHLWANKNLVSHMAAAMFHNGYIYGTHDAAYRCLDLDGTVRWSGPNISKGYSVIVDNLILMIDGRTGDLVMAEASPAAYRELGRAPVLAGEGNDGQLWAPLAFSNGKLVIRNKSRMVCLDLAAK